MIKIESYAIMWNTDNDEGSINLILENGETRMLSADSAAECSLLVDILRNESPVYIHVRHNQLITGIEPVGEGEEEPDSDTEKNIADAA